MDLNFNKYICSVIALSLINPSNFWGAVHSGMWGMERRSRRNFEDATAIFHFSFLIFQLKRAN